MARERERGAVLIVVLLVLVALLGVGVTGLWLTRSTVQIGANIALRNQALYMAEAALERARWWLNASNTPDVELDRQLQGTGHALDNIPNGIDSAGRPNGVGAIFVDGDGPLANVDFPPPEFGRPSIGRYTVWIRNDTAECRMNTAQANYTNDNNYSVVLRAVAVMRDGRTQAVIEVTVGPPGDGSALPGGGTINDQLCYSGKNSCDASNNVAFGVFAR